MTNIPVKVVQGDRDAALDAGRAFLRWTPRQIEIVEAGEGDDAPLVQAFARHRQSSTTELVELLREAREALHTAQCRYEAQHRASRGHFSNIDRVSESRFEVDGLLLRIDTLLEQRGGK